MRNRHELKVGDRIKDNDPRQEGRVLTITEVSPTRVRATREGPFPKVSILKERIHTDGKPRRTGFSLVGFLWNSDV
jgi:hypothetical protein